MPAFIKSKRNIFILACILFILLTCGIIGIFLIDKNNQTGSLPPAINPPTQDDQKPAPPAVEPTPAPVKEKTPITLKFPSQFTKATYVDEGCGHQSGIEGYTYNLDDTLRIGQLLVNKKSLPMTEEQKLDFDDVYKVVDKEKTVIYSANPAANEVSGLPLRGLYTECGGAAYYPTETYSVDYVGVDKALAIATLGGFQSYFDNITYVDMTIWIYMYKGDEVAQISTRFKASEVFTVAEGEACMVTNEDGDYIDPACVANNARGNAAKLAVYRAKTDELKSIFQLVE